MTQDESHPDMATFRPLASIPKRVGLVLPHAPHT